MSDRLAKVRDSGAPERRSIAVDDFEVRADDDSLSLEGYATVFDAPYDMYGGPKAGGWTEIVDRSAFDVTLKEKPDLHLLINHGGMPLARTKSGTLQLDTDEHGLKVSAPDLDLRDPDVQRLRVKMERGDMDEMSFGFRVPKGGDEFDEDAGERLLTEVSLHKGDVSIVNFGANPATSAKIRSLFAQLADGDVVEMAEELRSFDRFEDAYRKLREIRRELKPPEARTFSLSDIRKQFPDL